MRAMFRATAMEIVALCCIGTFVVRALSDFYVEQFGVLVLRYALVVSFKACFPTRLSSLVNGQSGESAQCDAVRRQV